MSKLSNYWLFSLFIRSFTSYFCCRAFSLTCDDEALFLHLDHLLLPQDMNDGTCCSDIQILKNTKLQYNCLQNVSNANLVGFFLVDFGDTPIKGTSRIEDVLMKAELVFYGVETSTDTEKFTRLSNIMQKVGASHFQKVFKMFERRDRNRTWPAFCWRYVVSCTNRCYPKKQDVIVLWPYLKSDVLLCS